MSSKNRQDWGCLHWFLLGFAILGVVIILLVMLVSPSGGDGPCQSMVSKVSNLDRESAFRADHRSSPSTERPAKTTYVHLQGSSDFHPSEIRHTVNVHGPVAGAKPPAPVKPAPAPVKPNLTKPGPAKTAKPAPKPSKAPTGPRKGPKVKVDLPDCD